MEEGKEPDEPKRGPKGGKKHQPGRGHDRKSQPRRAKRFRKLAEKRRAEQREEARRQWERWDSLTEELRKLLPELRPTLPRPEHED